MEGSLRALRSELRTHDLGEALRLVDRAWRCLRGHAAVIAPIYGALLALDAHDDAAALGLLRQARDFAPDPDVSALIARSLLRLNRPWDAQRELVETLQAYCVEPGGLLAHMAGEIMRHPAIDAPGWIGRGPKLELIGELASHASELEIRRDGRSSLTHRLRPAPGAGRGFCFEARDGFPGEKLEAYAGGTPLLGSGCRTPSDFGLDGRAMSGGARIHGWARLGWCPTRPVRLRIADEDGRLGEAATRRAATRREGWTFTIAARAAGLRGHRLQISALLPDGRWLPLPDSPLLLERAARTAQRRPTPLGSWRTRTPRPRPLVRRAKRCDLIIPVYRGRAETLACIDAVLSTRDAETHVVVVDDATDDVALATALDSLAAEGRITLLRNEENRGFVASVNRALALHPTHDAVLLNSDTLVFGDWLPRLRAAAYQGPTVGTVTPLSNNSTITSYPRALGGELHPDAARALHALAASSHSGTSIEIPVGVGSCLYVRRDCLSDVGLLDAEVFGKGYGEETDFCLRARRRGWSHRLAADVFVYHAGGLSFGARRAALLERSQRLLNLRHPGYDRFIASFIAKDPLHAVRRRLDERRLLAHEGRFVLIVTLALPGGVERFVAERARLLRAQGLIPLLLRPAAPGDLRRCALSTEAIELPNLRYDIPAELSALEALLGALRLEAIEIQHFLHLDARVIDMVRALPCPYDVMIHDYAWICPRVTLIDGSGRYCGEPAVSACQSCVRRNGSELGEAISVRALRARSAAWLRGARRVTAPSADTAMRLQRHFPDLPVDVQPHAVPRAPSPLPPRAHNQEVVRVAVIGAIGMHKGYRILLNSARDARARKLPLEFVVIGYTHDDAALLATGKAFVTGRYGEAEVPHLLRREHPDVAWLPSVWPETWCYALDHARSAGLPVAAFDLGAIAERLRAAGGGMLLPLELAPRRINECLLQLRGTAAAVRFETARFCQSSAIAAHDHANMAMT
jgi:GT2 family glycosyltransferase/glycosyltransferase involved in cell wall biosynthesis